MIFPTNIELLWKLNFVKRNRIKFVARIEIMSKSNWPLWEIFIRSKSGLSHKHVGSLHASDAKMAIENARDVYTRRMEGVSIWVVPSSEITASAPADKDAMFDPANDKVYRHPTFYDIPDEIGHM
jgi:ring-1,2-phenylacetyl-CoA epoxidase subunit PaaB